jgi:hypothetical protein
MRTVRGIDTDVKHNVRTCALSEILTDMDVENR